MPTLYYLMYPGLIVVYLTLIDVSWPNCCHSLTCPGLVVAYQTHLDVSWPSCCLPYTPWCWRMLSLGWQNAADQRYLRKRKVFVLSCSISSQLMHSLFIKGLIMFLFRRTFPASAIRARRATGRGGLSIRLSFLCQTEKQQLLIKLIAGSCTCKCVLMCTHGISVGLFWKKARGAGFPSRWVTGLLIYLVMCLHQEESAHLSGEPRKV